MDYYMNFYYNLILNW